MKKESPINTTDTKVLTEIERQQKALQELPEDFSFPLFNYKHALESQRRSGYHNSASAAREIIDNAIEAGASQIHVAFDKDKSGNKVTSVAFIDNGPGMTNDMARLALSWGGGTHFDNPDFIGRFGFGLPNASINQTRKVEVYTRTSGEKSIRKCVLDIDQFKSFGTQTVPKEQKAELPDYVKAYLKSRGLEFTHGTVVVWVKPDRLSYRKASTLKEHFLDDFGGVYRYLLGPNLSILVEAKEVVKVDPLFLDPQTRYFLPEKEGGAILILERFLDLYYVEDTESGAMTLIRKSDFKETDTTRIVTEGKINVRIARFPYGFVEARESENKPEPAKRFEIRKHRRGISFVRAKREIETVDAFPRTKRDMSAGLGSWPTLQSYAYHWAMEVRFDPTLDDVFGITNDKQKVRPTEEFWKMLVDDDIDDAVRLENKYQSDIRDKKKRIRPVQAEGPSPAEAAAAFADSIAGNNTGVPAIDVEDANKNFRKKVSEESRKKQLPPNEAEEKLNEEIRKKRYKIEYVEMPYAPFYLPEWRKGQYVVQVNRSHPFFDVCYSDLIKLATDGPRTTRAKEALDLLLISLSKAELEVNDEKTKEWYRDHRTHQWSRFLENSLKVLAQDFDDNPSGNTVPLYEEVDES